MYKMQGWFHMSHGISVFYREIKDNPGQLSIVQHFELRAFVNGLYTKHFRTVDIDTELVGGDVGNLEQLLEPYADSLYKVVKSGLLRKVVNEQTLIAREFDPSMFPDKM